MTQSRHNIISIVLVLSFLCIHIPMPTSAANWDPVPVTGTRNLLIVLTSFADRAFTTTPAEWNTAVFDTTPGVKSVANYYYDNSLGNLTVVPVAHSQSGNPAGIVSVTLASNHPNYGDNFNLSTEKAWLQEALNVITSNGWVDFSSLDANSDNIFQNEELVVYFIPAGYEASGSVNTPNIWAHAWGSTPGIDGGGVDLRRWAMNGELNGSDERHTMGVITHELGHSMCGLPDLYDLTYTNSGMGAFSLMATGSWGRLAAGESSGATPVALDAWSRQYLGWTTPAEVPGPDTYTFYPALDPAGAPLRLTSTPISATEYFLAENRYNEGWDLGLERWLGTGWGGGVLIQHIDISVGTPPSGGTVWGGNDINRYVEGGHQGVMVEEASTAFGSLLEGTSVGHYTHLFYDPNNGAFSDGGVPDSRLYDDTPTGLNLSAISVKGRIMSGDIGPAAAAVPYSFSRTGGTGILNVEAAPGYSWTASSSDPWMIIDSPSGGTGSGTVAFSISASGLDEQRQGTFSVAGQTVTVTQEGGLAVAPVSVTAGPDGGSGVVIVNCSSAYKWTANSNDNWITIESGSTGTGPGSLTYSVQPNMDSFPRQGTLSVAGRTVAVEQGSGTTEYFDQCDSPRAVECLPYTDYTDNMSATQGQNDPATACGTPSNTVWYSYVASTFHDVTVDTTGSDFDTLIAVYMGSCASLTEVACNDDIDFPINTQSSVTFSADPGMTYYIMAAGSNLESGFLTLNVNCSGGDCPSCSDPFHCYNGFMDADETGIDCGGIACLACDTIAPASLITSDSMTDTELIVSGTASDGPGRGVASVEVSVDDGPWQSATDSSGNGSFSSWSYSAAIPSDGTHSYRSRATDNALNVEAQPQAILLFIDNTNPASVIVSPSDGSVISGSSCSISGTSDDGAGSGVARVEVSTNGGISWEIATGTTSWSYSWAAGSAGSRNIVSRAIDRQGHAEVPGAGVDVTVIALGTPEPTHYDWDAWTSNEGCALCHHTPSAFLPQNYRELPGFCRSCHNAAATAHGKNLPGSGHSMFVSVTSTGFRIPTYGNITSDELNNQPFSRLFEGDKAVCVTCHNPMGKTEDMGRVWEPTVSSDHLTYRSQNGGWAQSGTVYPRVYRDTSLWSGPSFVKDRKDYLVDPSEYSFNEYSGILTFHYAQDPLSYVYLTVGYPYLRASNAYNTLCSDCHTQQTHRGANCLTCHTAHGTSNIAGIREQVRTTDRSERAVLFSAHSSANSFADGDTTYDGICEVCHTATKYHRWDGTGFTNHSGGVDQSGKNCSSCHSHASGFAK